MTDPFSVLSIGSIITSRTLIFQKYRKKEIPRSNYQNRIAENGLKKRDQNASLCIEKLEFSDSCKSNSLKFHSVKRKNYKSPK